MKTILFTLLLLLISPSDLYSQKKSTPIAEKSRYLSFTELAGHMRRYRTIDIGTLEMLSGSTLGGYHLTLVETKDEISGEHARALLFSPLNQLGFAKVIIDITKIIVRLPSDFMKSNIFFVDDAELPNLINAILTFEKEKMNTPSIPTYFSYYCDGGFSVTFGYDVSEKRDKKRVWKGVVGGSGQVSLQDFLPKLIDILQQANNRLTEFDDE